MGSVDLNFRSHNVKSVSLSKLISVLHWMFSLAFFFSGSSFLDAALDSKVTKLFISAFLFLLVCLPSARRHTILPSLA